MRPILPIRPNMHSDLEPHLLFGSVDSKEWERDNLHLLYRRRSPGYPFGPKAIFRLNVTAKTNHNSPVSYAIHSEAPAVVFGLPHDLLAKHKVAVVEAPLALAGWKGVLGRHEYQPQYVRLNSQEVDYALANTGHHPASVAAKGLYDALQGHNDHDAQAVVQGLIKQDNADTYQLSQQVRKMTNN